MRAFVFGAFLWVVGAIGAIANPEEMQTIIDRQLDAFRADDFAKAMQYASPALQQYFRTPEIFQQMVTRGYPMVWRPQTVEYLQSGEDNGIHWQRVMISDTQGIVHILEYHMLETEDGWRINGVQILEPSDLIT
ncbi:MAG: DUF4864 domain-containing protein [Roseobacter sp.]